jgi:hypothetical protein
MREKVYVVAMASTLAMVLVPMFTQLASAAEANNSFFVLPESVIGVIALVAASLAVLGGFMFLSGRNSSDLHDQIKDRSLLE